MTDPERIQFGRWLDKHLPIGGDAGVTFHLQFTDGLSFEYPGALPSVLAMLLARLGAIGERA